MEEALPASLTPEVLQEALQEALPAPEAAVPAGPRASRVRYQPYVNRTIKRCGRPAARIFSCTEPIG